jgi:hypothetical protein
MAKVAPVEHRCVGVAGREERLREDGGEKAVDEEVVELDMLPTSAEATMRPHLLRCSRLRVRSCDMASYMVDATCAS